MPALIDQPTEIESNKLGQEKGNAVQKKFAAQMVADHTKTSTELKGLVSSGKVKLICQRPLTAHIRASSINDGKNRR
jgi:predicted outer membrane protein